MKVAAGLAVAIALLFVAGCGGGSAGPLTIYSGREEELVAPLFEKFTAETGLEVEVRYGDSAELAATIAEEGDNSPADVFFAQDPGSLGSVEAQLSELPAGILDRVPPRFRDGAGRWVGTSGRSRVLVYNTESVTGDLPASVFDLVDTTWKGAVGIAPTNGSFQAFVTAMRLSAGETRTKTWLEQLRGNEAKTYEKNTAIVEAVAAGEVSVGLVNHYYLYLVRKEQPDAPIANHFFPGDDPGSLVSVAGAGVLTSTDQAEDGRRLIEFLLSDDAQRFYVDEAEEAEYPIVAGIAATEGLPPLDELKGPNVDLSSFGPELERTIELLRETGWLT